MKSAWNIVGLLLWIILLAYAIFIIYNIAVRRSRLIINGHYDFSLSHLVKTTIQIVILFIGVGFMSFESFHTNVSADGENFNIKRDYQPLILDTNGNSSYYVKVKSESNPSLNQSYSYLVNGRRLSVSSSQSSVLVGTNNEINVQKSAVRWNDRQANKLDQRYQKAWVAKVTATYKDNLLNGIGMRAGRQYTSYTLIRIPDSSFIYNDN